MKLILSTFLATCLFIIGCKNNTPEGSSTIQNSTTTTTNSTPVEMAPPPPPPPVNPTIPVTGPVATTSSAQPAVSPPTQKVEPAQNAQGVWHFTCPKGCKGGAGANGPCAKCKTPLTHNVAYHAGATPPPQTTLENPTVPTTESRATPPTPEPAQNAKGVWHYTCAKGCAGGAGSASACSKCGGTLAHNATYHQ
jgi:hypothetical protein